MLERDCSRFEFPSNLSFRVFGLSRFRDPLMGPRPRQDRLLLADSLGQFS
jgi:hypothetical protein